MKKKIGQPPYQQRYEQMYSGMKRPSHFAAYHRRVALSAVHVSLFTLLNIVDEAVLCTFPPSQRAFTHSHATRDNGAINVSLRSFASSAHNYYSQA